MVNRAPSPQTDLPSILAAEIRTVSGNLKRRLREYGGNSNLTPSQVSVVLRLEKDGPTTVSSLARAEGIRPQSMSSAIASLQQAGLVRGVPDPDDRRQTQMSLTQKCLKWLRDGGTARQDWLTATIAQRLSTREQQKLHDALQLLRRLAED